MMDLLHACAALISFVAVLWAAIWLRAHWPVIRLHTYATPTEALIVTAALGTALVVVGLDTLSAILALVRG